MVTAAHVLTINVLSLNAVGTLIAALMNTVPMVMHVLLVAQAVNLAVTVVSVQITNVLSLIVVKILTAQIL